MISGLDPSAGLMWGLHDNSLFPAPARKKIARQACLDAISGAGHLPSAAPCPGAGPLSRSPRRPKVGHLVTTPAERRRSVAFLEDGTDRWSCFLVTFRAAEQRWQGYFAFRPSHSEVATDEVRTANIFVEHSEAEIHAKARGLGRPLLRGLLESALHASGPRADSTHLRGRFRSMLSESSKALAGSWVDEDLDGPAKRIERLRSLYESYVLDQVSHFICLVEPEDFEAAVDRILEGESIDFRAGDRVQFARMVIDFIERRLPLPDFETWAADFLAHPEAYRLYAHTLQRQGRLP